MDLQKILKDQTLRSEHKYRRSDNNNDEEKKRRRNRRRRGRKAREMGRKPRKLTCKKDTRGSEAKEQKTKEREPHKVPTSYLP